MIGGLAREAAKQSIIHTKRFLHGSYGEDIILPPNMWFLLCFGQDLAL